MTRVEVIPGPERRRRWTDEQKRAIVEASFAPGAIVAEIARRADIRSGQIYRWRRELGAVVDGFAQVLLAAPEPVEEAAVDAEPVIEVEFGSRARVRIPASVPAELAAAVVKALSRR
jgi:transposase